MQALIQQVKISLEQNPSLNEIAKVQILLVVQEMYDKMLAMGLSLSQDLLIERLKTVTIEEGTKFLNRETYQYDVNKNKINFRLDKINEDSQENILCQALFAMSYSKSEKDSNKGIDAKQFAALAKGTFEMLANNIVPNNGESGAYEDEQIITNLMNDITDGKILYCFLQADNQMLEETIHMNKLLITNSYANYNLIAHPAGCKSQLGSIQEQLINQFFKKSPIEIKNNISDFESHLVTNPNVMSNPTQYDLSKVKEYYKTKKQEYQKQYPSLDNIVAMPYVATTGVAQEGISESYTEEKKLM